MQITQIFSLLVDLAESMGVSHINKLEGAWICPIDAQWTIAINGTKKACEVTIPDCMGAKLEPMEMAVFFNGWLAGLMNPCGGTICAGEAGNEDALIAAMEARLEQERQKA